MWHIERRPSPGGPRRQEPPRAPPEGVTQSCLDRRTPNGMPADLYISDGPVTLVSNVGGGTQGDGSGVVRLEGVSRGSSQTRSRLGASPTRRPTNRTRSFEPDRSAVYDASMRAGRAGLSRSPSPQARCSARAFLCSGSRSPETLSGSRVTSYSAVNARPFANADPPRRCPGLPGYRVRPPLLVSRRGPRRPSTLSSRFPLCFGSRSPETLSGNRVTSYPVEDARPLAAAEPALTRPPLSGS